MSDYSTLLETARDAVAKASDVCRSVQRTLDEVRELTKDDRSPVTVADYAAQAVVGRVLAERLGTRSLVGEEDSAFLRDPANGAHLEATLAAARTVLDGLSEKELLEAIDMGGANAGDGSFWTLDPVDGTKGFLRRQQYAVSLAYIEHGVPMVAALGCPSLALDFSHPFDEPDERGTLFITVRGEGAWEGACVSGDHYVTKLMRPDPVPESEGGDPLGVCMSVESAHSSEGDTARVLEALGDQRPPARLDSQAKYGVVARGQADAYLRLPTRADYVERIWDHAAGSLVAAEAGCAVTDMFGELLDFSQGRGLERNKGIVCAPPRAHGVLMGAIESLGLGR